MQNGQRAVFGSKVVAPLAHAVGFVNREQGQQAARVEGIQQRQKAGCGHPLGRGIQQGDVAAHQAAFYIGRFLTGQRGIQKRCADAGLMQSTYLVVHQGDQGRNYQGKAVACALACNRRDLVAQGFATTRGHQYQRIAAAGYVLDDSLLRPTKRRIPEYIVQDV